MMTQLQSKYQRSALRFEHGNFPEGNRASQQQRERWDKLHRQLAVLKQQATIPEWALKWSFSLVSDGLTGTTHHLRCLILFSSKGIVFETLGDQAASKVIIQYNITRHNKVAPATHRSFQHFKFYRSLYTAQIFSLEVNKSEHRNCCTSACSYSDSQWGEVCGGNLLLSASTDHE